MQLEFIKHLSKNKYYKITHNNSQESKIRLISDDVLKVLTPRGMIILINLNAIAYVKRNTKGVYVSNVEIPQSILHWLWTNLQMDEWEN